jgi:catechol 2,3-dioxygenase-like lactoylglutathione lyase family enzyme
MPRIAIAVEDFQACVATFRDRLGLPVIDLSDTSVDSLGAKLAMCVPAGGSNIEIMSPGDPATPLSQSLERFLERRGEGLFALMLEAADPNAEAEELTGRGMNVLPLMAGAGGRDIHPNATHGVLIRVYPTGSFQGPQNPDQATEAEPTRLSGISRVIIAVHDLDHAATVYGRQLAMAIEEPELDADRGVRSVICRPPAGGVIELVSVADSHQPFAAAIDDFLKNDREGMYALVLQSSNPDETAASLAACGMDVAPSRDSAGVFEIERAATFGARVRIEAA